MEPRVGCDDPLPTQDIYDFMIICFLLFNEGKARCVQANRKLTKDTR